MNGNNRRTHRAMALGLGVLLAVAVMAAPAAANPMVGNLETVVQIVATSNGQTVVYQVVIPATPASQGSDTTNSWTLPSPITLTDSQNNVVATINSLSVQTDSDPAVSLSYSVTNNLDSAQAFSLTSSVVSFSPIVNPKVFASAGVLLTDNDGDGAQITGLLGGNIFDFEYNGGTVWTGLLGNLSAAPFDVATENGRIPGAPNLQVLPGTVSSIQSEFDFILSANDSASVSSNFYATLPEPGTMALLALGGVGLLFRRRRARG